MKGLIMENIEFGVKTDRVKSIGGDLYVFGLPLPSYVGADVGETVVQIVSPFLTLTDAYELAEQLRNQADIEVLT